MFGNDVIMSKLSNIQSKKFGGLIAVLNDREPYEPILKTLEEGGFVDTSDAGISVTEKGKCEIDRLATLAGFNSSINLKD